MDWNPVAMTRRGGDTYELARFIGSVQMRQVCEVAKVDEGEYVRQGGRLFKLKGGF